MGATPEGLLSSGPLRPPISLPPEQLAFITGIN